MTWFSALRKNSSVAQSERSGSATNAADSDPAPSLPAEPPPGSPPADPRNAFIRRVVPGKTFIDIGGLSNVIYERVSVAAEAGAAAIAMMDVEGPSCPWWPQLHARLQSKGIVLPCECISGDITVEEIRPFDVVLSSGVLYHLPSPMLYLEKLRKVTKEYCILVSSTIARKIESDFGTLTLPESGLIFVPALADNEKRIIVDWFQKGGRGDITESEERFGGHRNLRNYYPNWFFPTVPAFRAMAECAGFDIEDEAPVEPNDLSYALLLRPI